MKRKPKTILRFFNSLVLCFGFVDWLRTPFEIISKSWEQFDYANKVFDREAATIKTLYGNLFLIRGKYKGAVEEIVALLRTYVTHTINYYPDEIERQKDAKIRGDKILEKSKQNFMSLINSSRTQEGQILIPELVYNLNLLIDIRGERISLVSQSPFSSMRIIALTTSIVFLLPLFYIGFGVQSGFLENFIITCVTMLAILIFLIVEDLDNPFKGLWKVNDTSFRRILEEMESYIRNAELENLKIRTKRDEIAKRPKIRSNKK